VGWAQASKLKLPPDRNLHVMRSAKKTLEYQVKKKGEWDESCPPDNYGEQKNAGNADLATGDSIKMQTGIQGRREGPGPQPVKTDALSW